MHHPVTKMLWNCCVLLVVTGLVTSQISDVRKTTRAEIEKNNDRQARATKQNGIFGFFATLRNIKNLYDDQYNETANALQRVMTLVSDGFSDTVKTTTQRSQALIESSSSAPNETMPSTTAKYRISRQELGYILGKNYRGLQKLLRIELDDAAKQSRTTIKEYRRDFGRALAPYTVVTKPVATKQ